MPYCLSPKSSHRILISYEIITKSHPQIVQSLNCRDSDWFSTPGGRRTIEDKLRTPNGARGRSLRVSRTQGLRRVCRQRPSVASSRSIRAFVCSRVLCGRVGVIDRCGALEGAGLAGAAVN